MIAITKPKGFQTYYEHKPGEPGWYYCAPEYRPVHTGPVRCVTLLQPWSRGKARLQRCGCGQLKVARPPAS